jgi:hypothetical protein
MPVAALIVVGPGVEVKAVKSDSLGADGNHRQERPNLAIEAILVHSEVCGGVAQADKTGQKRTYVRGIAQSMYDHRRPY